MTKSQLIESAYEKLEGQLKNNDVEFIVNAMFEQMSQALKGRR